MKTQLKLTSCAVIAIACAGLCLTASIRAQSAPEPTGTPAANKKENPYSAASPAPSPTPTTTPRS